MDVINAVLAGICFPSIKSANGLTEWKSETLEDDVVAFRRFSFNNGHLNLRVHRCLSFD